MAPFGWRKDSKESKKRSSHHGAIIDDFEVEGTSRAEFSSNTKRQKRKSLLNSKQKPTQPTVEDADTESDREYETRLAFKTLNGKRKLKVAMRFIKAAAATLADIGDAEEIEALFRANGVDGENEIEEIRKNCYGIIGLLPDANFTSNSIAGISTIGLYEQTFIYRASSSLLYLLRPIDVFKGNQRYHRKKVFGFIRKRGSSAVLMNALPGWAKCVDEHPRLLDPVIWTEVVQQMATFHRHKFRATHIDLLRRREKGDSYASHVEPRLMVWFAIDVWQKHTGKVGSPLDQIGDIWRLGHIVQETIEAEIVLGFAPCPQCLAFQQFFETYTPIKFSFIVMKNLGEVKSEKGKLKPTTLPLFAEEYSDSESELNQRGEEEDEYIYVGRQATPHGVQRPKERFQIVIPSRPASHGQETHYAAHTEAEAESEKEIEVQTRVKVSKAHRQIDFDQYYHTPPKSQELSKKRMRTYGNSSDDDEYEPPSSRSRIRKEDKVMTPRKKVLTRNGPLTPPKSAEFGRDALEYARKIKRMR